METMLTAKPRGAGIQIKVAPEVHAMLKEQSTAEQRDMLVIASDLIRDGLARRQSERRQLATA